MSSLSTSRTALVVETNYLVAAAMESPLVAAGYRVLSAIDPAEALALLDGHPVQVAVIDYRLQHLEPGGLAALLNAKGIPFLFCTAASVEEVLEQFPDARVIQKPFSDTDLLSAVTALVAASPNVANVSP